jgi:hypothetical protein
VESHCWKPVAWQLWHDCPPAPHEVSALPGWQVPDASQQPIGHVCGLHEGGGGGGVWQVPLAHVSPGRHEEHECPPKPHAAMLVPG